MPRKHRLWPWIVATLIGVPVLYVLGFIPFFWALKHEVISENAYFGSAYVSYSWPLVSLQRDGPDWARKLVDRYEHFLGSL